MFAERSKAIQDWAATCPARWKGKQPTFDESAAEMRELLGLGLLRHTSLRDEPEWFFEAHRAIALSEHNLGMGFWTRLTVQFNLFAGTVLAVGGEEQVAQLDAMQEAQQLGCFGLTEKFAGVSSGLVVETLAEYDRASRQFVLRTPSEGAKKNWISQGFVADKSVVVADLLIDGKSKGPHAFLIDFRTIVDGKKQLVPGITLDDMGPKTAANSLDNAWIHFDGVRVPESALLNRYATIDANGHYVTKEAGMFTMGMIGQRLFTGRVGVAQVATLFGKRLFAHTKEYTDKKQFNGPKGMRPPLSMLPQVTSLFAKAEAAFDYCERYNALVEAELCDHIRRNKLPPPGLTDAIATAKVRSVETCVTLCFKLKQTVGAYALMEHSQFGLLDNMHVAKCAEGESCILMAKMARDRMQKGDVPNSGEEEQKLVAELRQSSLTVESDKAFYLAELVMDRVMQQYLGSEPVPKGVGRTFADDFHLSRL
jgi:acyl-CoA oxidase